MPLVPGVAATRRTVSLGAAAYRVGVGAEVAVGGGDRVPLLGPLLLDLGRSVALLLVSSGGVRRPLDAQDEGAGHGCRQSGT